MRTAAIGALLLVAGAAVAQQAAPPPPPVSPFGVPTPTVFTSKIGFFTPEQSPGASYPRVIQLKIGAQKGTLLATYARRGDLPVYRSTDNGETWQLFSEMPQLRGEPCLYELPVQDGRIPRRHGHGLRRRTRAGSRASGRWTWRSAGMAARAGPSSAPSRRAASARYDPMDRAGLSRDQNPVFEPYLSCRCRRIGWSPIFRTSETRRAVTASFWTMSFRPMAARAGGRSSMTSRSRTACPGRACRSSTQDGKGKFYMSYELVSAPGYALEPRTNATHFRTSSDGLQLGRSQGCPAP